MSISNLYIESANVNLLNGVFDTTLQFKNGFNIISGENGTAKTRLLTYLKSNGTLNSNSEGLTSSSQIKVLAFSPKRNSERKTVEAAFEQFRQQNRKYETLANEALKRLKYLKRISSWIS